MQSKPPNLSTLKEICLFVQCRNPNTKEITETNSDDDDEENNYTKGSDEARERNMSVLRELNIGKILQQILMLISAHNLVKVAS